MNTFRDSLNQRLKDDESFRKEYTAIQPEMEIIRTLIKARKEQNLTQADLAMRLASIKATSADWNVATVIHP